MRNYLLILALCMLLGVAGCAGGEQDSQASDTEQIQSGEDSTSSALDNAVPAEREPDLTGVVKSITGNEVVLALVEMPEMPKAPDGAAPNGNAPTAVDGAAPPDAGGRPQMKDMTEEERQAMREQRKAAGGENQPAMELTYTGEEISLTIPVGVTIVSRGGAPAGEELDLTDIQKANILSIWYKDGAKGENAVVEYVRMMSQSGGSM